VSEHEHEQLERVAIAYDLGGAVGISAMATDRARRRTRRASKGIEVEDEGEGRSERTNTRVAIPTQKKQKRGEDGEDQADQRDMQVQDGSRGRDNAATTARGSDRHPGNRQTDRPRSLDGSLKIMVFTDNHLGYLEHDPIRKDDSFEAFEEAFKIALEKNVDLVLLGGDIFHDNKPSKRTICKTIEILRRYCLSDRPVDFEVLNSAKEDGVLSSTFGSTNCDDPNFHVGLPTFTIHGNHDDPAGVDLVSALDILASSNLLNYFGKSKIEGTGTGQIKIKPVLLSKGKTKVAIYGLGWMRDERLSKLFQMPGGVKWCHPDGFDSTLCNDDFFNIFTVHQNRAQHNPRNCISESLFWHGLDLVIWGHEHESLPAPTQSVGGKKYLISQPGSTVQTALTPGEAKQKHCLFLEIQEKRWRAKPIPLTSVRPFIFDNIVLREELDIEGDNLGFEDKSEDIAELLEMRLNGLLDSLGDIKDPNLRHKIPLVRLRVDYNGFTTINSQRFGQKFVGKVANPNDIILFTKSTKKDGGDADMLQGGANGAMHGGGLQDNSNTQEQVKIDEFIAEHLSSSLEVLSTKELNAALHDFVDKDETKAMQICVKNALKNAQSEKKAAADDSNRAGNDIDAGDLDGFFDDVFALDATKAGGELEDSTQKRKGREKANPAPKRGKTSAGRSRAKATSASKSVTTTQTRGSKRNLPTPKEDSLDFEPEEIEDSDSVEEYHPKAGSKTATKRKGASKRTKSADIVPPSFEPATTFRDESDDDDVLVRSERTRGSRGGITKSGSAFTQHLKNQSQSRSRQQKPKRTPRTQWD